MITGAAEILIKNVKSGKCLSDPHPRKISGTIYLDQKPCRSYPNAVRWFENAGASGRFALQNVADVFGRAACARNTPAHNNFVTMGQIGSGNYFWH